MSPLKLLEMAVGKLQPHIGKFAVAGGLAASFYRKQPRLTNDADIAVAFGDVEQSKKIAKELIESLGMISGMGWIPNAGERLKEPVALVIGRMEANDLESTIDFLLPTFPWVENAVRRAQDNLIDYGFAELATLMPEDLIVAKCFALGIEANRFTDLDDIQSIFAADTELDLIYLSDEFSRLQLSLPNSLAKAAPRALARFAK